MTGEKPIKFYPVWWWWACLRWDERREDLLVAAAIIMEGIPVKLQFLVETHNHRWLWPSKLVLKAQLAC
jgi:hypothetical protein